MSASFDTSDCMAYLKRCEAGILDAGRVAARAGGDGAVESVQLTTKFKNRSGDLRKKTRVVFSENTNDASKVRVESQAPYAWFVDRGSKAVKNTLMRFVVGGVVIFRRNRKAIPATFFMAEAERDGENAMLESLEHGTAIATR